MFSFKKIRLFFAVLILVTLGGCSSASLESYNRTMYDVNKSVDKYTLKPLAKGYQTITPKPVQKSVSNFFNNIGEISTIVNSLLQGKIKNAALSGERLVFNSTFGLGGLFDVASAMNITVDKEDFGQTFRAWGVPAGPYVVLPFLGPSTVTDAAGLLGNYAINPISRYNWSNPTSKYVLTSLFVTDKRASFFTLEALVKSASTDEYGFVKNTYLQSRNALVRDGRPDESIDEDFDKLFDDEN